MKIKLLFVWLLPFIFFLFVPKIFAQEKIESFDVNITAHKDGSMTVEESIDYNFGSGNRHGIFRNIPLVSRVGPPVGGLYRIIDADFLDVKRDGNEENYEVNRQPKETEVKIGDPDKTITGKHNYIIIYTVKNGIGSNYETHDEIYWNVTGNEWQIPIEKASYKIETDFGISPVRSVCYTGPESSELQNCKVDGNLVSTTASLDPNQGLTAVSEFPVDSFPDSILNKSEPVFDPDFLMLLKIYVPIVLGLNFLLAPYLIYWYLKNKSKQRFGPPSVNFDIPKNTSPQEAGIIDNHTLEKNDIVAAIFNLAIRRHIKIEEIKEKRPLMPDKTDHKLIKLKDGQNLDGFEKILMEKLFEEGDSVKLDDLKKDFYLTFSLLEKEVFESLVSKKLYIKNPKNQMAGLLTGGIIALAFGNLILGPVLIFLSRKLNGRTESGDKLDWEVDGLKIFLKAMSRHHKFQSENLITVENYIPYAIALGLQDEFMEQLKIINPDYKPSWYSGSHGFYYGYSSMYSSFGSNITSSAPSSSSGFSGGSSGGGGGGGGGGSW